MLAEHPTARQKMVGVLNVVSHANQVMGAFPQDEGIQKVGKTLVNVVNWKP